MRLSNTFGSIILLFVALMLDFTVAPAMYNYVTTRFTGDSLIITQIGIVITFILITLGLPILGAVEDDYE